MKSENGGKTVRVAVVLRSGFSLLWSKKLEEMHFQIGKKTFVLLQFGSEEF
jgi:hypothetical protein